MEQGGSRIKAETLPLLASFLEVDIRCFFETDMLLPQQLTILEESERLHHENAGFRRQLTELSQSLEQLQGMDDELRYYQEQLRQQISNVFSQVTGSVSVHQFRA